MLKRKHIQRSAPVTMRDVAKLAGVSQSTVSRVLSNTTSVVPISEDTYKRVLDAVTALGYYPNLTARSLRAQHTFMIAMMIADISNPFYHFMVRSVQDSAYQHNYDMLIANTDHVYENEKHFCETMMRRPVDGVIMIPYQLKPEDIDLLIERTGAAVVVLAQPEQYPALDTVYGVDSEATYDAVKWLIEEKHHTRIAYIGVTKTYPTGLRRWKAYTKAMHDAGLAVLPGYEQEGDFTVESGERTIKALLELREPPTAVFVCNDLMAIGALNAAQEMGARIPDDIAIVGMDNIPDATRVRPRLTTVAQFPAEIGHQLASALFDRIEARETGPRRVFEIPLQLIERQST